MPKHIGIVGGISPESTATYYDIITRGYNAQFGGSNFPQMTIRSVNLQEIADYFNDNNWNGVAEIIINAISDLKSAGAEFAAIASNTPHIAIDTIRKYSQLEIVSISEATSEKIKEDGLGIVGLLGTKPTMEYSFFAEAFMQNGIGLIIPKPKERTAIDSIIWNELVHGTIRESSRNLYRQVIGSLASRGAKAVILGCTEIPLLIGPDDSPIPTYDTTAIHANAILKYALR